MRDSSNESGKEKSVAIIDMKTWSNSMALSLVPTVVGLEWIEKGERRNRAGRRANTKTRRWIVYEKINP